MTLARHPNRLLAAAAIAVLIALAALLPAARPADAVVPLEPDLQVEPASGPAGSTVIASGTRFFPGTSVLIRFTQGTLDEIVGSAGVGADGTFMTTAAVPADAVPGPAQFVATNDVTASADFTVEGDEIGDTPRGNAEVCEIVVILERVRNRIGSVAGSDTLKIQTNARPAGAQGDAVKAIQDTFVRNEWKNVATIVGRWTQPKTSFAKKVTIVPFVQFVPPAGAGGRFSGANILSPVVDCEDTEIVEFVEMFDADGNLVGDESVRLGSLTGGGDLGRVDLVYRIVVRELQAQ